MADSLRRTQGNQTPYRNTAIDGALGREAHREQNGAARATRVNGNSTAAASSVVGGREAHTETLISARPREAHLGTVISATPRGTVSVGALQRLGALLQRDENLARRLAKNPRRALASLDFISERDKEVLAGINSQFWSEVAAVSGTPQRAGGKGGVLEGVTGGAVQLPESSAADPFGGSAPMGWGNIGGPSGPGIVVGNGVTLGGRSTGGGHSSGDGTDAPPSGVVDYGFDTGNAADPRSPTGRRFGGGGQGGGGNPFLGNANPPGYIYGDPSEGGGVSGGRLPSRAVLAGSAWRALHPGRDVADNPDGGTPATPPTAATPSTPAAPSTVLYIWPDGTIHEAPAPAPAPEPASAAPGQTGWTNREIGWAVAGGVVGATIGGALLGGNPVFRGVAGFSLGVLGVYAGYGYAHKKPDDPADPALVGGSGGPGGPRAFAASRAAQHAVRLYMPAPDDVGPGSPRSAGYGPGSLSARNDSRALYRDRGNLYMPAPDDSSPGSPRSTGATLETRAGLGGQDFMPAPDDPRTGGPRG